MSVSGLRAVAAMMALMALAAPLGFMAVTPARAQSEASAAASGSPPAGADVEQLRERAATFWAARVAGDPKGQWELLEPRGRGRLTPADLAGSGGAVKYLTYQVEDATVTGYFATVRVRLLVQMIMPTASQRKRIPPSVAVVPDAWVRIGGIWYRSLEQESGEPGQQ